MQTTKEYTHKLLLETARRAFFKKGFKAVSMREISKLSGIGLSNIYNYYPCKDDLLADVLHPLLEAMNSMLEDHNRPEAFSLDVFTSEEYHRSSMKEVMNIVRRYREEFKLLFSSIQDSRFNDYWEQWIKRSTVMGIEYMEGMKKLYPDLHTDISLFFMHFTKTVTLTEHRPADGMLTMRVKNTTYNVNIFFNPNAKSTLDTQMRKIIQKEAKAGNF